ncbi:MAG TPA: glycosyltransferase family 1 protein, partial [Ktedonobacterales bacterium]|nr:glycosyltransferase family 1 protein [Ktedonobacterales bacterium]
MRIGINGLLASTEQSYRNAGVSRYTLTLLNALSAFDQANEYIFVVNEPQLIEQHPPSSNTSVVSPGWSTRHAAGRVLWEHALLAGEARRQRLDRFHALMNVLPLRLPCPGVVTIHDLAFLRLPECFRPARRAYQQLFARQSARSASIVIAISEHTRQDVIECWNIPAERIRVIPPILEERFTQPCPEEALSAFRERLGFPEPYILYLGTLEPRKNLSRLLDAYALLKRETSFPHRLVVAGARGWYYQTLEQQVRDLGLQQQVHFIGYVLEEDKPLWYHAADLFVYPSRYEGFGLPVAEAMACGVPV